MVASGLCLQGLLWLGGASTGKTPPWTLALGAGVFHVATLILVQMLLRAHTLGWRESFGLFHGTWIRRCGVVILLTVPALAVAGLVHSACGWVLDHLSLAHESQNVVEAVRQTRQPAGQVLFFVFAVGTAPIVEEVVFRGLLWPLLRDRGWGFSGAVAAAFLFAAVHVNLAAFLPLWILGLFWTWLYERTEDLTAPILSHALFNAANFLWIVLVKSAGGS